MESKHIDKPPVRGQGRGRGRKKTQAQHVGDVDANVDMDASSSSSSSATHDQDYCFDLEMLKYKTHMEKKRPTDNIVIGESKEHFEKLNRVLEVDSQDTINKERVPWSRMHKTMKVQKLREFAERHIQSTIEAEERHAEKINELATYLITCLQRKRLVKSTDVKYNRETGKVESIPMLMYTNNKYTLRKFGGGSNSLTSSSLHRRTVRKHDVGK